MKRKGKTLFTSYVRFKLKDEITRVPVYVSLKGLSTQYMKHRVPTHTKITTGVHGT